MSELIKISTIVQAKYWLEKGETLIFTTIDGNGYITNIGNETEISFQPKYGLSETYRAKKENSSAVIETLLNETDFYVCEGGVLIYKTPSLFQRFMDLFRSKN